MSSSDEPRGIQRAVCGPRALRMGLGLRERSIRQGTSLCVSFSVQSQTSPTTALRKRLCQAGRRAGGEEGRAPLVDYLFMLNGGFFQGIAVAWAVSFIVGGIASGTATSRRDFLMRTFCASTKAGDVPGGLASCIIMPMIETVSQRKGSGHQLYKQVMSAAEKSTRPS